MRVLITGGAGYIGTELVHSLNGNPAVSSILIYDNLSRGNNNLFIGRSKLDPGRVGFMEGDILDSRKLRKALKDIDMVYHLAAKVTAPFDDKNHHLFEQVNHWGTAELVYAVEESGVDRFVYMNSASVYGTGDEPITIDTPPRPKTFYGSSKLRGEEHAARLQGKLKTWIIRGGNVYGQNRGVRFDTVINRFMFDANFNGRVTIQGDGTQVRPFVHIKQVAECLSLLPTDTIEPGTCNLVGRNLSVLEIAETVKDLHPELEMIYVDQHLTLGNQHITPDKRIMGHLSPVNRTFREELAEFKGYFTF